MFLVMFGGKIWLIVDFIIVFVFLCKLFLVWGIVKCKWDGRFLCVSLVLCWLNHGNEVDVNLYYEIFDLSLN